MTSPALTELVALRREFEDYLTGTGAAPEPSKLQAFQKAYIHESKVQASRTESRRMEIAKGKPVTVPKPVDLSWCTQLLDDVIDKINGVKVNSQVKGA